MRRLALALLGSAMLTSACVPPRLVVPDPTVVHMVAKKGRLTIYVETADGKLVPREVEIPAGWAVAGPPVIEADP